MLKSLWIFTLVLWVGGLYDPRTAKAESIVVKYPASPWSFDDYALRILVLALDKSKVKYVLQRVGPDFFQDRALAEIKKHGSINILWAMTTVDREKSLHPIRIPIEKGLIGWRVLMIRNRDESKFGKIKQVTGLKKLLGGSGHDWPETDILKANGFNVFTSSSYEGLFQMLKSGRVDFMSRSIPDVWTEIERWGVKELSIEKNIALHYPTAVYFFVNKGNIELAEAVELGLRRALKDKSLDKYFNEWAGAFIEKSHLRERRIFKLQNPMLPKETPLENKEYWFRVE